MVYYCVSLVVSKTILLYMLKAMNGNAVTDKLAKLAK